MKNIIVTNANKSHKEFILHANKAINSVNETEAKDNNLVKNIDNDLFSDKPVFKCLIAELDGKPVGMILYSYVYWANDGQVIWISQMFVEPQNRSDGIFFELIKKMKEENKEINIMSCATGNDNLRMQKILKVLGGKEIDLKFYYIKK